MKKLLFRVAGILAAFSAPLLITGVAHAAADTCTWTGGGSDENFSTAANWSGCDNGTVPESGDTLVFPTSVDSDTTAGDDRILNNDISSLSVAGITVSGGTYPAGDIDNYRITGNNITLTGDLIGAPGTSYNRQMRLEIGLVAAAPVTVESVTTTAGLAIGSNNVTVTNSFFNGGLTGSGGVTLRDAPTGVGLGGPICGTADPSSPFGGDSSGFSGFVNVIGYSVSVTPRANDMLRHAAGITLDTDSTIVFTTDNGVDMTFATPIAINGGTIEARQVNEGSCTQPNSVTTITLTGSVTATGAVDVRLDHTNLTLSGAVTGGSGVSLVDGISKDWALRIGSEVFLSDTLTTTYTGNQSGTDPVAGDNQVVIVSAGATTGDVYVGGGTLKGSGTVGAITLVSGIVAPGLSPGCLASGNLSYSGGTLQIEINGATVCTEYDQQQVTGTVALAAATTLNISRLAAYVPALNASYTIISNDASDAVTGTFVGLAQGATVVVDGVTYTISYTGGDGNDVTLTVTAVDASVGAPNTGAHIIKSGILLPIFAILSAAAIIYMNFVAPKKK